METEEYKELSEWSDEKLFGITTEIGQRGLVAKYLLDIRRNKPLVKAAQLSAFAAIASAVAAVLSMIAVFIALFRG